MLVHRRSGEVLVTGAEGFMGSHVVRYLRGLGHSVLAVGRKQCDLTNSCEVDRLFRENLIHSVIHCASEKGFREVVQSSETFYSNLRMYENLSVNHDGLLISMGTGDEFDHSKSVLGVMEEDFGSRIPSSYYGFSKYVVAKLIGSKSRQVNLRMFNLFGLGESSSRFITSSIIKVLKKEPIMVYKNIEMDFFYVGDLCSIIEKYINGYISLGEVNYPRNLNLCYSEKRTVLDVASIINSVKDYKVPVQTKNYTGDLAHYSGDGSLLRSLGIDFIGLENGIKETFELVEGEFKL